jgi:hypothetical protein
LIKSCSYGQAARASELNADEAAEQLIGRMTDGEILGLLDGDSPRLLLPLIPILLGRRRYRRLHRLPCDSCAGRDLGPVGGGTGRARDRFRNQGAGSKLLRLRLRKPASAPRVGPGRSATGRIRCSPAVGIGLTRGLRLHVMACLKHFALNSMETERFEGPRARERADRRCGARRTASVCAANGRRASIIRPRGEVRRLRRQVGLTPARRRGTPASVPVRVRLGYTRIEHRLLNHHDTGGSADVHITNTGDRQGSTVVQVYAADVPIHRPLAQTLGFRKVTLRPGAQTTVRATLDAAPTLQRDPATLRWSPRAGDWACSRLA